MHPFAFARADSPDAAIAAIAADPEARFLAGGTTLVDLMRLDVMTPSALIDINDLDLAKINDRPDGGLRIGALCRMSDTANHPAIRDRYPVVAESLLQAASPQLRNMATIGGNLMQRTRCPYFRDVAWACNKRKPGSGCSAQGGEDRMLAVLGISDHCLATHPSDLAVALVALDAVAQVRGPEGDRSIPLGEFHRLPGATPHLETALKPAELIVAVDLPAWAPAKHSRYLKVRDRASYEFALVSVAAALDLDGDRIRECRIALGGVATKPWRATAAEAALKGQPNAVASYRAAAEAALRDAKAGQHNGFKIELVKRAIVRVLGELGGVA